MGGDVSCGYQCSAVRQIDCDPGRPEAVITDVPQQSSGFRSALHDPERINPHSPFSVSCMVRRRAERNRSVFGLSFNSAAYRHPNTPRRCDGRGLHKTSRPSREDEYTTVWHRGGGIANLLLTELRMLLPKSRRRFILALLAIPMVKCIVSKEKKNPCRSWICP